MSISQAVYEAQIQRIADLQARLTKIEAEQREMDGALVKEALAKDRAEKRLADKEAEAANALILLRDEQDSHTDTQSELATADALLREARKWSMPPEIHTAIDAHLSRKEQK